MGGQHHLRISAQLPVLLTDRGIMPRIGWVIEIPQADESRFLASKLFEQVLLNLLFGTLDLPHAHLVHFTIEAIPLPSVAAKFELAAFTGHGKAVVNFQDGANETAVEIEFHSPRSGHGGQMVPLTRLDGVLRLRLVPVLAGAIPAPADEVVQVFIGAQRNENFSVASRLAIGRERS